MTFLATKVMKDARAKWTMFEKFDGFTGVIFEAATLVEGDVAVFAKFVYGSWVGFNVPCES